MGSLPEGHLKDLETFQLASQDILEMPANIWINIQIVSRDNLPNLQLDLGSTLFCITG